ncbi:MAG: flagellar basal body-associated protein FliL [Syntrophaceae bacterium PtaU1.Bin231]|nr:MAG: flagellar basal body-associated protein FliL [Syntrophaceae bacterium PtaU1.Bin231]HOG16751.1 flagellar basal body-associated FliL family protein [Syntrophales bacterium]
MAKEELKEEEQQSQQPETKKKGSLVKWIIIGFAALVVVGALAGGGAFFYFKMTGDRKAAPAQQPAAGIFWPMDPFIVNLVDNNGERYLKVIMQLEVSDQAAVAELDVFKPKLRDNILDLLSVKSYKELIDVGGKQRLRDEIVMRLNSFLTKGKVVKVYFTEFVIQ